MRRTLVWTVELWLALSGHAELVLSDHFTYPEGALVTAPGSPWTTHSGTSGQTDVLAGQLQLTQAESEDVHALLAGQPYGTNSGTVLFARFKICFTSLPSGANGAFFAHFKDASTGFRCRLFATTNGAASGSFRLGIANAGSVAAAFLPMDLQLQTNYWLVARLIVSNATSTLWLDPSTENDPGISAGDPATPMAVTSFAFRQSLSSGNGMGKLAVDDLVVGTTFADVVSPVEPPPEDVIPAQPVLGIELSWGDQVVVRLRWNAEPDRTYSIFQASGIDGPFAPLATGLIGTAGLGEYVDLVPLDEATRFYRLSTP